MINALNDAHLWGDIYDRKLTDIFAVESDIAKTIADTLQAELTGAEKQLIAAQPTSDTAAYELYLKGRSLWSKRGGENLRQAIGFYEQAIARDPKYALAYSGLAEAYAILPAYTTTAPQDAYPTAKAAALKALQLDEKLAEAHTALGSLLCHGDLDMSWFNIGISTGDRAKPQLRDRAPLVWKRPAPRPRPVRRSDRREQTRHRT